MQVEPIVNTSKLNPDVGSSPIKYTDEFKELLINGLVQVEDKKPEVNLTKGPQVYHMEVPVYKRRDNSPYEIYKENSLGVYLEKIRKA